MPEMQQKNEDFDRDLILGQRSSVVEQGFRKAQVGGSSPPVGSTLWLKSKYANLVKYLPSGMYFVRARVGGKLIRHSLKTKSVEIAKLKLDELLERERARAVPRGRMTIGECAARYLVRVRGSGIKPRSVDYREETWRAIVRQWPELSGMAAETVTNGECEKWLAERRKVDSASRFNGKLETLRGVFALAREHKAIVEDPTAHVERASLKIEPPTLPSSEQFQDMLKSLDAHEAKRPAAFTVRLLAFTGIRTHEARHLQPGDVNFQKGLLHVRVTKNGAGRFVPIISEAEPVLKQFVNDGARPIDCRRALRTASKGMMTPHDLRHLFATRCLESGVDVRTVAGWLGHRDGGALLLRRYAHLRDGHSQSMAKKVKFL